MNSMEKTREFLKSIGLPGGDAYDLPTSEKRFADGGQYRFEVPGIQGPKVMKALLEAMDSYGLYLHRVTQTQGIMRLTDEEISKVEKAIFEAGAISKMLDENLSLLEIAKKVTGDKNVKVIEDDITPKYQCNCSKEKMAEGLLTIGKEEIKDIIEKEGKAELVCHFCNKKYQFNKEELEKMIQ